MPSPRVNSPLTMFEFAVHELIRLTAITSVVVGFSIFVWSR